VGRRHRCRRTWKRRKSPLEENAVPLVGTVGAAREARPRARPRLLAEDSRAPRRSAAARCQRLPPGRARGDRRPFRQEVAAPAGSVRHASRRTDTVNPSTPCGSVGCGRTAPPRRRPVLADRGLRSAPRAHRPTFRRAWQRQAVAVAAAARRRGRSLGSTRDSPWCALGERSGWVTVLLVCTY
jgi:hypothetical protein